MKLARVCCLGLLVLSTNGFAKDLDVNNPTGSQGLIMIDKLGGQASTGIEALSHF